MKNELGFIPDTISAISGTSMHIQGTLNFEAGQPHQDSTDMFIDQILKQRAQKNLKEEQRIESAFLSNLQSKPLLETKELQENNSLSEHKSKQSLRTSGQKFNKLEMLMRQNESIAQKSQVSEANDSSRESKIKSMKSDSGDFNIKQPLMIEDRIETLQNHTNQQLTIEKQLNQSLKLEADKLEETQKYSDNFQLPKFDKIIHFQLNNASKSSNDIREDKHEEIIKKSVIFTQKQNQSQRSSQKGSNKSEKKEPAMPSSIKKEKSQDQIFKEQAKEKSNFSKKQSSNNEISDLEAKIQNIENKQPGQQPKDNIIQTPIKMFSQRGFYEFVQNSNRSLHQDEHVYRQIAIAIADHLNKNERIQGSKKSIDNEFSLAAQNKSKSIASFRNISVKDHTSSQKKDSLKNEIQQDDLQTQYSEFSRDIKILQHRYESNLAYLQAQTKQLLGYYHFMIMQQQKKELRREIMKLQISNNRLKIQHRTASYTKRFNFISPMNKTNSKPIQFIPKTRIHDELVIQCQNLKKKIEQQKKIHVEQDEKRKLLTNYYDLIKSRTISDKLQFATQFKFDSEIGQFSPIKGRNDENDSECSIAYAFQRSNSRANLSKSKSKTTLVKGVSTSVLLKQNQTNKLKLTQETTYNLNKYKTQITKEMIHQYEVYNLGRVKRIRDQTNILKKQLDFVQTQLSHFQQSFGTQMKAYEELTKPKIKYEAFKVEKKTQLYTKSPFSRDYFGNNKGSNNINIYRPDTTFGSPQKKKMNKSLSQSKYTIRRPHNNSSSKQVTISFNLSPNSPQKSSAKKSITRKIFTPSRNNDNYGLYRNTRDLNQIKEVAQKQSKEKRFESPNSGRKSLSIRSSKNLMRFNTQGRLNSVRDQKTPQKGKLEKSRLENEVSPNKKQTELSYNISLQDDLSIK